MPEIGMQGKERAFAFLRMALKKIFTYAEGEAWYNFHDLFRKEKEGWPHFLYHCRSIR